MRDGEEGLCCLAPDAHVALCQPLEKGKGEGTAHTAVPAKERAEPS